MSHPARLRPLVVVAIAVALAGCRGSDEGEPVAGFVDVTEEAGILHRHHKPQLDPALENIMPWMCSVGATVAAADYDRDGWVDLYVTNSRKGTPNYLYRNNGDGTFTDVAPAAGLAEANDEGGVSTDAIWADLDDDGDLDLYLVRWGTDRLYDNNGDGTFSDVTRERLRHADGTPGAPWANGNAVIAFDHDLDGRLDLYVGNYFKAVDLWNLETTYIMHDSFEVARNADRNFLYHQEPDGTFTEIAVDLAVDDTGWTLAVGSADLNNDGWPDLYAANDFGPDRLFYNDGRGGFHNLSSDAIAHDTRKGMNVDFGDFNNDGWLDIYVTNITTAEYLQEGNMLWRNNGPGADGVTRFMDVSPESGTYDGGWGWGAKFLDHDNDGDLDLFTVNGFVSAGPDSYWYDLASWTVLGKDPADSRNWPTMGDRSFSGYEKFRFFRNDGFEEFTEQAAAVGLDSDRDGRGVALLDYDNDGDTDIFVANQGQPPHLFRNDTPGGHWLDVLLIGAGGNLDAIGARVTVVSGDTRQIRERDGGTGYSGQSDRRLHFGLGERDTVALLEVRWPDGGLQYLEDVAADRLVTLEQDPEQYAAMALVAVDSPEPRELPRERMTPELPAVDPVELDRMLTAIEHELRAGGGDHALAHAYRKRAATHGQHDRAIDFFAAWVEAEPGNDAARLELSVAYVDKIPTCGGLAAIVCKGTLARKSLDVLDEILERRPDWWTARYGRGMNHLHWPRALRHSGDAVADFSRALALQRAGAGPADAERERVYVLLGDAQAKNKAYADARRTWSAGIELFPGSRALEERLAIDDDDALLDYVMETRALERPIDTDFSFFER
ncbi:MAG: FG-GAP-like repeat-containing protein [Acidobacteriota bacterium]|nr:FG-GAP-like repeat-containing protein [Acidobacteriota bacterium]